MVEKLIKTINGSVKPISVGAIVGLIIGLLTFAALVWAEGQRVGSLVQQIRANRALTVVNLDALEAHAMIGGHSEMAERMVRIETKVDILLQKYGINPMTIK